MLFGREIIIVFGSTKYLAAESCIIPICVGLFFNYLFQLFARVQEYYEHKLLVVVPSILCAVLNIVLNLIFIKLYGYIAASYTTAICYLIFCILHYLFYVHTCKKEIPNNNIYNTKTVFLIALLFLIVSVFIFFVKDHLRIKISFLAIILILCIVFRKTIFNVFKSIFIKRENATSQVSNNKSN